MDFERGTLVIVTGMYREAVLFPRDSGDLLISGKDNSGLGAKIEASIARGATGVISAGLCAGLAPELPIGAVVIGSESIAGDTRMNADKAWREALAERLPDAISGAIAGTDTIITDPAAKAGLYRETGAPAADMETHVAAKTAAAHGLPFAALRVISDCVDHALPPLVRVALDDDGKVQYGPVMRSLLANPAQIPPLIRLARNTDRAMASLLRCFDLVGGGFACPYIG